MKSITSTSTFVLTLTVLFLSLLPLQGHSQPTPIGSGAKIIASCEKMVRRKMPEVKDPKPYCECAAAQHITKIVKFNQKKANWLINLYDEKQSAKSIDLDPYGIAAFDIEVFEKCKEQLNLK